MSGDHTKHANLKTAYILMDVLMCMYYLIEIFLNKSKNKNGAK